MNNQEKNGFVQDFDVFFGSIEDFKVRFKDVESLMPKLENGESIVYEDLEGKNYNICLIPCYYEFAYGKIGSILKIYPPEFIQIRNQEIEGEENSENKVLCIPEHGPDGKLVGEDLIPISEVCSIALNNHQQVVRFNDAKYTYDLEKKGPVVVGYDANKTK